MTYSVETTEVEVVDQDLGDIACSVKALDRYTAEIAFSTSIFNVESWKEFSKAVEEALTRLELLTERN